MKSKKIINLMFLIIAILFVSCDKTSIMNNTDDGKNLFRAPGQEITYENFNAYVASVVAKKFISFMDERFVWCIYDIHP